MIITVACGYMVYKMRKQKFSHFFMILFSKFIDKYDCLWYIII